MKTLKNTSKAAQELASAIMQSGLISVWDLDGVLLDASHRQAVFSEDHHTLGLCTAEQIGTLNLEAYRALSTPENIAQDKSMALIEAIHILNANNVPYYVCTARVLCRSTKNLLKARGINPVWIMARAGEHDRRRDDHLKVTNLQARFSAQALRSMVLIDDNKRNLTAVQTLGLKAVHVPFHAH